MLSADSSAWNCKMFQTITSELLNKICDVKSTKPLKSFLWSLKTWHHRRYAKDATADEATRRKLVELVKVEVRLICFDCIRKASLNSPFFQTELLKQEGQRVPDVDLLTPDQWEYILASKSRRTRIKAYQFMWLKQTYKKYEKVEKEEHRAEIARIKEERTEAIEGNNHIVYGLFRNSFTLKVNHRTKNRWKNNK